MHPLSKFKSASEGAHECSSNRLCAHVSVTLFAFFLDPKFETIIGFWRFRVLFFHMLEKKLEASKKSHMLHIPRPKPGVPILTLGSFQLPKCMEFHPWG